MSSPPWRNAEWPKISWCSGAFVLMPSTTISERAFRIRAMAVSRVSPYEMSFAISES